MKVKSLWMFINDGGYIIPEGATYDVEPFNLKENVDLLRDVVFYEHYNRIFSMLYSVGTNAQIQDKIKRRVEIFFKSRAYTINGMWESTLQEYSPVENYDRYEDTGILNDINRNDTEHPTSNTESHTGYSDTTTLNPSKQTAESGKTHINNTDKVSPDDNNVLYVKGGNEQTVDPRTDTITYGQGTSKTDYGNKTIDYIKDEAKRDSVINDVKDIKSHIHGNIGITSAMQLLEEQRQTVLYDFYKQVADLLVDCLCLKVY